MSYFFGKSKKPSKIWSFWHQWISGSSFRCWDIAWNPKKSRNPKIPKSRNPETQNFILFWKNQKALENPVVSRSRICFSQPFSFFSSIMPRLPPDSCLHRCLAQAGVGRQDGKYNVNIFWKLWPRPFWFKFLDKRPKLELRASLVQKYY